MAIQRLCKSCGRSTIVYSTAQTRCPKCQLKRSKQKPSKIKQRGERGERYLVWRDTVARPYLENRYGRDCAWCKAPPQVNEQTGEIGWHDIDHIKERGSKPSLKMDVHNIQFLCRGCHIKKTEKKLKKGLTL